MAGGLHVTHRDSLMRLESFHAAHHSIPLSPVGTHLALVVGSADLDAGHRAPVLALRQFVPLDRRVFNSALAQFEHLNVVGRAEARGTEKAHEIVEPYSPQRRRLVARPKRPRIDSHTGS